MTPEPLDIAVIGAGPCGLAVGVAAKRAGLRATVFDKGPIVSSLTRYPLYMTFFSTAEKLEIGGIPFVSSSDKPTRREALTYYRKIAEYFDLDVRQRHEVVEVARARDGFTLRVRHAACPDGEMVAARNVVYATGYFDSPNLLGVPGEDLPHVSHFFTEPHQYWRQRVVVVGGGNSAVEAALEVQRIGAQVTVVHFLDQFDPRVKPWVLPEAVNRVKDGSIGVRWRSRVKEITPTSVIIASEADGSTETLPADFVLALTGYRTNPTLLRMIGVAIDAKTGVPQHDPQTMESNVPGVFIAGVMASGFDANRIFIENGRAHGDLICASLKEKPPRVAPGG
ncbi:MAG TPA: YpdA family putative bacillithiol disulfide reductase [Gemmatimonadales bacterium]|nr:YpdA family putative bacillithiol disulfide reductase [Gemmatimonadales bacterium]